ncbi:hypothetical protein ACFV84_07635 [Kitasatospora sp. NPDC059811]|uniref:hypothetical protein n=1 Tax=Streptomycetaceae TaxID=2062 RepID=UPI0007AFA9CF|nr:MULTISPECIES: hypothetical protein [Streptomycetaceae]MDH6705595.1 hypothetical protein [Kitasatospora sp. MAA19]WSK04326.1 hypothetical protein OG556_10990 [Kitasatospora sp. NBC_01300]
MALSVSALVLFAILCIIFIRNKQLKIAHGIIAALFGFMLHETTVAGSINSLLANLAHSISGITGG